MTVPPVVHMQTENLMSPDPSLAYVHAGVASDAAFSIRGCVTA